MKRSWRVSGIVVCFVAFSIMLTGCSQLARRSPNSSLTSSTALLAGQAQLVTPTYYPLIWAIGESVTAGWYTTDDRGYPYYKTGSPIISATAQGTTVDLIASIQQNHTRVGNEVVEAGTYDWLYNVGLAQFQINYSSLLSDTAPYRGRLICLSTWANTGWANSLGETVGQYDAVISQTCASFGGVFVNLQSIYALSDSHCSGGGILPEGTGQCDNWNPSNLGQQRIAQAIHLVYPQ